MEFDELTTEQKRKVISEVRRLALEDERNKFGFRKEAEEAAKDIFRNTGCNAMQYDQFIRDYALLLLKRHKEESDFYEEQKQRSEEYMERGIQNIIGAA